MGLGLWRWMGVQSVVLYNFVLFWSLTAEIVRIILFLSEGNLHFPFRRYFFCSLHQSDLFPLF